MADDILRKIRVCLGQIEKLAQEGDLEGSKLEATLAFGPCDDDPTLKGQGAGK